MQLSAVSTASSYCQAAVATRHRDSADAATGTTTDRVSLSQAGQAIQQASAAELPSLAGPLFVSPEEFTRRVKQTEADFRGALHAAGISPRSAFSLETGDDGRVRATGAAASQVNQLLQAEPELAEALRMRMLEATNLATAQVVAAGADAWQALGAQASGEKGARWQSFMESSLTALGMSGRQAQWNGQSFSFPVFDQAESILASAPRDLGFGGRMAAEQQLSERVALIRRIGGNNG
ncbi:hypothetical protein ABWL39_06280 [Chitinivorax sp. PXF-14]|uniref:hypothetical protein n=1 Tax=Chitinivorax sp. PXF-14 TaxID=3230488 RepID=UPI0034655301